MLRSEPRHYSRTSEKGQALIEMTLVVPLILVFMLVILDFGIALDQRIVLLHTLREAGRAGAEGATPTEVISRAVAQSSGLLKTSDVTVCYLDGDDLGAYPGNAGDAVRVHVDHTYRFTVGSGELLTAWGMPVPSLDISPTAEARLLSDVIGATPCT